MTNAAAESRAMPDDLSDSPPDRLRVEVALEDPAWPDTLGADPDLWAQTILAAACRHAPAEGEVCVLLCGDGRSRELNVAWRNKDQPTNVLSFPSPAGAAHLGDIALALGVITREAQEQAKPFASHAAHMLVHGYLHLVGYDHGTDAEAEIMEDMERAILRDLGVSDPYLSERLSGEG
jgi:probable rRNA maturation factor